MIIFCLIAVCAIFLLFCDRKHLMIDAYTVLFVSYVYYGLYIPLIMTATGNYGVFFNDEIFFLLNSDFSAILYVIVGSFVTLTIGYRLFVPVSSGRLIFDQAGSRDGVDTGFRYTRIFSLAVLALFLAFCWRDISSVSAGYSEKIDLRYSSPLFSFLFRFSMYAVSIALIYRVLFRERYVAYTILAIGVFVSVAVLTFSKDPLVFAALTAFAFLFRAMPGRQLLALALVFLGVVVSLFVLLPAFSIYRGTGTLALIAPSDLNMRLISSDAQGPFSVLAVMVDRSPQFPMPSLMESVFLWVPRAIWPDRPFDAAEAFAQALVPDWQPGVGRGFSPFAEGVARFGVWLSPLMSFIWGATLGIFQRFMLKLVNGRSVRVAANLVIHGHIAFLMFRSPYSGVFTMMMQFWIPFLLLQAVIWPFVVKQSAPRAHPRTS